jgi:hypothetical protein
MNGAMSSARKGDAVPKPDISEFETLSKPRRLECGVKLALDTLKDDDAKAATQLQAALDAGLPHITHAAIAQWLQLRGVKVRADTVRRHRSRQCSCDE